MGAGAGSGSRQTDLVRQCAADEVGVTHVPLAVVAARSLARLAGKDKYVALDRRRRRAQIAARHALAGKKERLPWT